MKKNRDSRILLVDDDFQVLESVRKNLEIEGHQVVTATNGREALALCQSDRFDLVISDVRMPLMTGMEFLRALDLVSKDIPVILMTAFGKVEDAVWALKNGAIDFLQKPFKRKALMTVVDQALERAHAKESPQVRIDRSAIVGRSSSIDRLRADIAKVAQTDTTVLIQGESGTGKELVAREIHQTSQRSEKPFVAVNCAALPENLIESELFGHEKGAFSGADQTKVGLFEVASGGTIFLDEVGELEPRIQVKLLRVLQDRELRRVGSTASRKVNVRVLTATNQNLSELVQQGMFREDLYFRINVFEIATPSLADRKSDIPELVEFFLQESNRRFDRQILSVSQEALEALVAHDWPGNVRELRNTIERAVILCEGEVIGIEELPAHLAESRANPQTLQIPVGSSLKEVEKLLIDETLKLAEGDKNLAAKILGVNSRTIYRKLDKET